MFQLIFLAIAAIDYNAHLFHPNAQLHQYPGVILHDINRFISTSTYNIHDNFRLALRNHYDNNSDLESMIRMNYDDKTYHIWKEDVNHRYKVWLYMTFLKHPLCQESVQSYIESKLYYLHLLKKSLGDANYYAGIVPFPIPNYIYSKKYQD